MPPPLPQRRRPRRARVRVTRPLDCPLCPHPLVAQASVSSDAGASGWPPKLRAYVERAFAQCVKETHRANVERALKGVITKANTSGSLWSTDWDNTPIPHLNGTIPAKRLAEQLGGGGGKKRKKGNAPAWTPPAFVSNDEQQARESRAKRFEAHLQGGNTIPGAVTASRPPAPPRRRISPRLLTAPTPSPAEAGRVDASVDNASAQRCRVRGSGRHGKSERPLLHPERPSCRLTPQPSHRRRSSSRACAPPSRSRKFARARAFSGRTPAPHRSSVARYFRLTSAPDPATVRPKQVGLPAAGRPAPRSRF